VDKKPLLMLGAAAALSVGAAAVEIVAAEALSPGLAEQHAFTLAARGVQIYECRAGAWTFVAPEAELFDAQGQAAGSHGAGPYWQARDGSRIVGAVKQRTDAPQPGAIPWLLLVANGRGGTGLFGGVSRIQRVNTRGGSAPAAACASIGQMLRVPYTADYHFYKTIDRSQP
jgi:Protein of unknown function (DUF3455)